MSTRENLLAEIEAFIASHDLSPYSFGKQALNDPGFMERMRHGRDPRLGTVDRVRKFMREYKARPSQRLLTGAAA